MAAKQASVPTSVIEDKLDTLFELHRSIAFGNTMRMQADGAKLFMVKAYLTFASNNELPGYENGGDGWTQLFNAKV